LKVRVGRPPKYSDNADSKACTFGPLLVNQPERMTSATAAMVASSIVGRVKGMKGRFADDVIAALADDVIESLRRIRPKDATYPCNCTMFTTAAARTLTQMSTKTF
jgi:hypothetical protein